MYSPELRRSLGLRWASRAYVTLGFGMSSLYSRIGAGSRARHLAVLAAAGTFRLWIRAWLAAARLGRSGSQDSPEHSKAADL
jgi:hypothetical protein